MHKTILFILAFFISTETPTAQVLDMAIQNEFYSFADDVVKSNDGNWVIGGMEGYYPGWPSLQPVVYKVDSSGNILWHHNFGYEVGSVNSVNPLPDGGYIVSGQESGCDYVVPSFVARLDESGGLMWRKDGGYGGPYLSKVFCDQIFATEYEVINIYTLSGEEVASIPQNFSSAYDMETSLDESRLYIVKGSELIYFDCSDSETPVVQPNTGVHKLVALPEDAGASLAGISENALLLLDEVLTTESSVALTPGRTAKDITFCMGKYVVLTETTDPDHYFLEFYDENLAFVEEWEVGDKYFDIHGLKCMDGQIGIWGRERFLQEESLRNYHVWFQLLEEAPEAETDLAMQSISAETATLEVIGDYCYPGNEIMLNFTGLTAAVLNSGSETITEFKINFLLGRCLFICSSIGHYEQTFTDINLEPGASMEVFLPDFTAYGSSPTDNVDDYEACFWVSVPNKKTDSNHNNDSSCITFSTGIKELPSDETTVQIVPNPVQDKMEFQFGETIKTYELSIYDQLGRLVLQKSGRTSGKTLSIDFSTYPEGLYYYNINKNNEVFTNSFVKLNP